MKSLIAALSLSISIFFLNTNCSTIRKNTETYQDIMLDSISYSNENCYSRSLFIHKDSLYCGNSDGTLYAIHKTNFSSKKIEIPFDFTEIRDLALSNNYLIGMQSSDNGRIFLYNFESSPKLIEQPNWKGVFLDGFDFFKQNGFMMGDPIDSLFSLFTTTNGGQNWKKTEANVTSIKGEAGFAGSGTNVQILNDSTFAFISGGMKSCFYKSSNLGKTWSSTPLEFLKSEGSGAFSMHFYNTKSGVIVGGDYTLPKDTTSTSFYTKDGGNTWLKSINQVNGYRCCVIHHRGIYYACGTNGIDYSIDQGKNWQQMIEGRYFTMVAEKNKLYATMPNGKILIITI